MQDDQLMMIQQEEAMAATPCPPGLWDEIMERDEYCLACGTASWPTLQHLIPRSGCKKELRWDPKNLCRLCGPCHQKATDLRPEMDVFVVSRFGDQEANLAAFWRSIK